MSGRKSRKAAEPEQPDLKAVAKEWSVMREATGSESGHFNLKLMNQIWNALWQGEEPAEWIVEMGRTAATAALKGIAPRDTLEGMLAAQMVATHESAMDCFRRAQLPNQTFEGRRMNLEFANKLVRSYAALVETLDKHRGKGQQVVRVEHVTVNAGGQAIVGAVSHERGGGGDGRQGAERSHAQALGHAPEPPMRSPDQKREPVPFACGEGQAAL
jgi:hypothetical protein